MVQMAHRNPREVMSVLVQTGDFAVTRDWARLHDLPSDLVLVGDCCVLLLVVVVVVVVVVVDSDNGDDEV